MGKRRPKKGRANTLNKHQRAAFRPGEERVGREEIEELLVLSESRDPEDRLMAASYLCPCHVRRRIDEVWQALYRMLEDDDIKVRRAAWHTQKTAASRMIPHLIQSLIARSNESPIGRCYNLRGSLPRGASGVETWNLQRRPFPSMQSAENAIFVARQIRR